MLVIFHYSMLGKDYSMLTTKRQASRALILQHTKKITLENATFSVVLLS